jgi:serine/threonine protein kinase
MDVEGRNLAEAAGAMTPAERLEVLLSVAQTTAFAHEQGIVHRDLKPENILVEPATKVESSGLRWRVWLTDFGLAKIIGGEDLTRSGMVLGTPHYMSPEQVRGRAREMGPATDVWSLGVMLYECLTTRRPFDGQTALEIYDQIVHEEPRAPRKAGSRSSVDLETSRSKLEEGVIGPVLGRPGVRGGSGPVPQGRADQHPPRGSCAQELEEGPEESSALRAGFGHGRHLPRGRRPGGDRSSRASGEPPRLPGQGPARARRRPRCAARAPTRRCGSSFLRWKKPIEGLVPRARARRSGLPDRPDAPGVLEDEKALEYQEAALRKDPSYGPARYERAVLTFKKYLQELERPSEGGEENDRLKPEIAGHRESMVGDCSAVLSGRQEGLTAANLLVARGMLAYGRGQLSEARPLLEDAARADPLLDEVWLILGRTVRLGTAPGFEERERKYRAEEESYTQGLPGTRASCPISSAAGSFDVPGHYFAEHGRDPSPDFAAAEKDLSDALEGCDLLRHPSPRGIGSSGPCTNGLRFRSDGAVPAGRSRLRGTLSPSLNPEMSNVWRSLGAPAGAGKYLLSQGRDPMSEFTSAQSRGEFLQISKADGDVAAAHAMLGRLFSTWASHLWRTNRDPADLFQKAENHFAAATKSQPTDSWYLRLRATGLVSRAEYRESARRIPSGITPWPKTIFNGPST